MYKRVLSILLSCVLLLSCCGVLASEGSDSDFQKEIKKLQALEIMQGYEDGSFGEERIVSRMEFAACIIRILGCEELSSAFDTDAFTDVPSDSWGRGYVSLAYELKLIEGIGGGLFAPDESVTFNQAVKIMVSALGYGEVAEKKGGYPNGYLTVANSLRILKGLEQGERPLTRAEVAKLIENSLEIELAEESVIKSDGSYLLAKDGSTLLSKMDFVTGTGIVTSVYGLETGYDRFTLKENEVVINGLRFTSKMDNSADFILTQVTYYYKEAEDGSNVLYFMEQTAAPDNILTVEAESIADTTDLSGFRYYDEKDKLRQETLPGSLAIIYNGCLVSTADYSDSLLKPKAGRVMLVDLNEDKTYEYALVTAYENYFVEMVQLPNIYDAYGQSLKLDSDKGYSFTVYLDGVQTEASEIKKNDVLSVAQSLDGKNIRIEICRDTVSGDVEQQGTTGAGSSYYVVDGEQLNFSGRYQTLYDTSDSRIKKLSPGDSGIFYLDIFGDIAASEAVTLDHSGFYGYLLDIKADSGLSSGGAVKIMTTGNKFEVFECKKEIFFGRNVGSRYVTTKESLADIISGLLDSTGNVEMQMIKYHCDDSGNLTRLLLADSNANSDNFSLDVSRASRYYSNGVLGNRYILNGTTAWFDIPESGQYTDLFSAGFAPDFLKTGTSYLVELYDVENNIPGAVYCKSKSARYLTYESKVIVDNANSPVMFVDKVSRRIIDDEEWVCVSGYVSGEYRSVPLSRELQSKWESGGEIKAGTIIQYETNYAERNRAETSDDTEVMWVYNLLHDFNVRNTAYYQKWENTDIKSNNAPLGTVYGLAEKTDFPYLTMFYLNTEGTAKQTTLQMSGQAVVYSYSRSQKKWSGAELLDVQMNKELFVRLRYNKIREIVIVED